VPLGDYDDRLPSTARDPESLVALVERWGIRNSVNRVLTVLDQLSAE
jgi:hypothetical protein